MQIRVLLYAYDVSVKSHACGGTDTCLMRSRKNVLKWLPGSSLTLIFTLTLDCAGGLKVYSRKEIETCL